MGDATTHQIKTLRKLGDREAYWCTDCNKQWGPYDHVDESEECVARAGRETAEVPQLAEDTPLRS